MFYDSFGKSVMFFDGGYFCDAVLVAVIAVRS